MVLDYREIPDIVVRRLPIYARSLSYLFDEGVTTVSSSELGARIGVTAAQIRRDLSYFGEFGKQGKGYNVQYLLNQINEILSLDKEWPVALVGIGHLGQAVAAYNGFREKGFRIAAIFDHDVRKVGKQIADLVVYDSAQIEDVVRDQDIRVAIVAVPANTAQAVVDALVAGGVRAILNYAPMVLHVPEGVRVRELDPVVALQSMTYYLAPTKLKGKSDKRG